MGEFTCGQDVIDAINEFCKEDWRYSCSFGHIALDDYNLSDYHIKFCLRQGTINDWFELRLRDCRPESSDPESLNNWERYEYDDLTEMRDRIIAFLRFLLTIPENIRKDQ